MSFVMAFSDTAATLENVGGKGMSLSKMSLAGLPVPDGFHITTEAYRRFVAENRFQALIERELGGLDKPDPISLEHASQKIGNLFAAGTIPREVAESIALAYRGMKYAPVAVRSSATAEDLPEASFAGQQETFLNITGEPAVLAAVKKCWASLWTARAIAYRAKEGIDHSAVTLAVVVQRLVFADSAGVLFTANPITGKRAEIMINAAWGLGESLVSGRVTPDTIITNKVTGRIVHKDIAEKLIMTVRTVQGTEEMRVPDSKKGRPVISKEQARRLTELGVRIERLFGTPVDIEWALEEGHFFIVQARPITALRPDWTPPEPNVIYTRGSFAEHVPSPVTPLFGSLGLEMINAHTSRLNERVFGGSAAELAPENGSYQVINGYLYLAVKNKPLLLLFKSLSPRQVRSVMTGSVERWRKAREDFAVLVDAWEPRSVDSSSPDELLGGARALIGAACRYFTEIQLALPVASVSETLFTKMYGNLSRGLDGFPASSFLLGFETAALRGEKSLYDLSRWASYHPELAGYILKTPSDELEADYVRVSTPPCSPELWAEWRSLVARHVAEFCRTVFEYDFVNPTPQESLAPLFDAVKVILQGNSETPYVRQGESIKRREEAARYLIRRAGWPRRPILLKLLHWAQFAAPMRENAIFDMGMAHTQIRRLLNELGERFAAKEAIRRAADIYWLYDKEVAELANGLAKGRELPSLSHLILERETLWREQRKTIPPVMLPEKSKWSFFVHGGEGEAKDGSLVLKGIGTCGGTITAPACVLLGSQDFSRFEAGSVLVAVTTTPAWTPLFSTASAVVTDIGGPLSHSSIVAREYGIPAVMATRSATRAIRTGDIVTVDGGAGTVTVKAPSP